MSQFHILKLIILLFSLILVAPVNATKNNLDIYIIDVGQGDSTLVVGPEDESGTQVTILIDAGDFRKGKVNGAKNVRNILERINIHTIDYVVLSHYDADHMGGFVVGGDSNNDSLLWELEKNSLDEVSEWTCNPTNLFPKIALYDIGEPLKQGKARKEWRHCVQQLTEMNDSTKHIQIDEPNKLMNEIQLGGGYTATIVGGRGYVIGNDKVISGADSPNEMSISVLVSGSDPIDFDFLVTGDLIGRKHGKEDAKLEDALARALIKTYDLDLEVLRVGHHGAANATSSKFITELNPEVALISVGNNSFGHPDCSTLTNLKPVDLVIQTGGTNQNSSKQSVIANGTIHIKVERNYYTIRSLANTSSSENKKTRLFSACCSAKNGCYPVCI